MNAADTLALLPLILIAATAVVVMLGIACKRSHTLAAVFTLVGLAAAFISISAAAPLAPRQVTSLLLVDRYALFYIGLIILSAAAVAVFSYRYFENHNGHHEELYLLLLLATLGCAVLVASSHFVSFLLGLEILSISLYAMIAYLKDGESALEAGIKYLILASASAAFLLFGMALIYAVTGTMEFSRLREVSVNGSESVLLLAGIVLTITGIGFKLVSCLPSGLWRLPGRPRSGDLLGGPRVHFHALALPPWGSAGGRSKGHGGRVELCHNWGSFGFFGPLTVHPDLWNQHLAQKLLGPTLDLFEKWGVREAGLFTFAHSPKHIGLYQKFGFWPRFLTALMSKDVSRREASSIKYSTLKAGDSVHALRACRELTGSIYDGLDVTWEIRSVAGTEFGRNGPAVGRRLARSIRSLPWRRGERSREKQLLHQVRRRPARARRGG